MFIENLLVEIPALYMFSLESLPASQRLQGLAVLHKYRNTRSSDFVASTAQNSVTWNGISTTSNGKLTAHWMGIRQITA